MNVMTPYMCHFVFHFRAFVDPLQAMQETLLPVNSRLETFDIRILFIFLVNLLNFYF